jgi:HPt (histidine-containing phosphotransfer) domain-containing protein
MMPLRTVITDLPVDPEVLDMLGDLQGPGEPDVLTELVTLFLRDTPERLDAIDRALGAGDLDAVSRTAHALKGSAANLGAVALQGLAACVEVQARTADLAAARREAAALSAEYARVKGHLTHVLSTRPH